MTGRFIDVRSDTVTLPTNEMREAMRQADVGDAMRRDLHPKGEDPTTNRLESQAAATVGKEEALFVSSGTLGNLVALMAHTHRGDEIIVENEMHIFHHEVGAFAALAGLSIRLLESRYGIIDPADIEASIRPLGTYSPTSRLICLENTHNRRGGNAISPDHLSAMVHVARDHGLTVHLDGARIFNAAIALGVNVKELTEHADSVMFCLSKGLSAPIGSMIAGSHEFITRARRVRRMLGGDMRQSGVLSAAGIVALDTMVERLAEDHQTAALLLTRLMNVPRLILDIPPVPTNMVFIETKELHMTASDFVAKLRQHGVLCGTEGLHRARMVTHRHITSGDVAQISMAVKKVVEA
jgi:threonine aldolase